MNPTAAISSTQRRLLRHACRLWSLQTGFTNADGQVVEASPATLSSLLEALSGEKATTEEELRGLILLARKKHIGRMVAPVHVIWEGVTARGVPVHLPEALLARPLRWTIELESGETFQEEARELVADRIRRFEDRAYGRVWLPLRRKLPVGYHRMTVETDGVDATTLLMSAPQKVGAGLPIAGEKRWGIFSPLYGMKSERDWGIGDLAEMEKAQEFTRAFGGAFFGTLPMLPISCESEDCDPSPYSPVSRLFWNEVYLDVPRLVKESASSRAIAKISDPSFAGAILRHRATQHVDYGAVFQSKKAILEILAEEFFDSGAHHGADYRSFLAATPEVEAYSAFRSGGDEKIRRYHLYVQFQMDRALKKLDERVRQGEIAGLYLDFPVGVGRGGFDSQRFASSFLEEANAGAPPDLLFMGGQDWGFAPLHPIHIREQGYDYFIKCVRHHMKYASVLRLDHIMAFHRIYAVPRGASPKEGAYLRYRPDEFYALLSIEAEKSNVRVVGEDLGTVPDEVRDELKRHDCLRMWVLPFEAGQDPEQAMKRAPTRSLACLNTHDMAPFAGFWNSKDIDILGGLGLLSEETKRSMLSERTGTISAWVESLGIRRAMADTASLSGSEREVFGLLLRKMAMSSAELLLINIEDLWAEEEPQNVPGTWKEYPNWRRKLALRLEDWSIDARITDLLNAVSRARLETGRGTSSDATDGTRRNLEESNRHADDPNAGRSPSI